MTYWRHLKEHPRAQPDMYKAAAMECFDKEVTSVCWAAGGVVGQVKLEPLLDSAVIDRQTLNKIFELLKSQTVPLAFTRSNIWEVEERPRSLLLGAYFR